MKEEGMSTEVGEEKKGDKVLEPKGYEKDRKVKEESLGGKKRRRR